MQRNGQRSDRARCRLYALNRPLALMQQALAASLNIAAMPR
ncbi:hypothetical protein BLL52_1261 [Rhodoferax antarcticus ANT.BR]|uniref:Uncharacterized protein n=1 Tax=Rhodoferax antarcticus ANT.BR TaxID=1111071 RepID=A0A1Q8YH97_9BURK|nr:hypothetical protein BLL52_1261 [Rhodoferax antarcticus ANT.BR]